MWKLVKEILRGRGGDMESQKKKKKVRNIWVEIFILFYRLQYLLIVHEGNYRIEVQLSHEHELDTYHKENWT